MDRLLSGMHLIAPRTETHEDVDLSPDELAQALDLLGSDRTPARTAGPGRPLGLRRLESALGVEAHTRPRRTFGPLQPGEAEVPLSACGDRSRPRSTGLQAPGAFLMVHAPSNALRWARLARVAQVRVGGQLAQRSEQRPLDQDNPSGIF